MRVGLVALAEHTRDLESRAARAEALDEQFRDLLCAVMFDRDLYALEWLMEIVVAHRRAWELKKRASART